MLVWIFNNSPFSLIPCKMSSHSIAVWWWVNLMLGDARVHTHIHDDATTLLLAITANFKVVPTQEGSIGRQLARDSLTTTTVSRLPVLTLGDSCVPATVNFLQYLVTGSILTVAGPFQLPDPQSGTYFIRDPTISADCFRRLFKTYLTHSAR